MPVTVTGVSPEPTVAVVIESEVMLGVLVEVLEPLLPPQPAVMSNSRTTSTLIATEKRCCISLPNTLPAGASPSAAGSAELERLVLVRKRVLTKTVVTNHSALAERRWAEPNRNDEWARWRFANGNCQKFRNSRYLNTITRSLSRWKTNDSCRLIGKET